MHNLEISHCQPFQLARLNSDGYDSILIDGNSIDGKKSSVSVVGTLSISANSKFTVQVGNALAVSGVGNLSIESPTIENHGTIDATANLTWRGPVAIGSPSRESLVYQTRGEAGILTADTILIETDTNLTFVNPLGDDALSKDLLHSTNNMSISASSVTFDGKTSRLTAGENIEMHINSILGSGSTLEAKNILISNKDVANISITNTNITAIDGKIVIQNKFERGIALNTANALSATGTTADGGRIYIVSGASLPIDPLTAGDTPGLYIGSPIDPIFEPTRAYHFNKFAGGGVVVAGQPNSIIFFGIQGTPTVPGAQTLFEVSGPPIPTAHNKNETMNIEGSSVPEFQPVSYIQECLLPGRSLQIQHTETASASYRLDLEKGQLKHLSESMIQLISGEIVIIAKRTTTILTDNAEIRILPGSALFIKLSNEKCLEINILHADKRDGALVLIEKQKFLLSSGKRLVFRKSARNRLAASIARRCIQTVQLTDSSIELSEFSLLSLSQNSDILRWSLHQKADPVMRKCFKTAAALSMLFIKHGSYQK